MTEDEAKTKWCPFVRLTADGPGEWHINRDPSLPSSPGDTQAYRCITSACMAWRRGQPMPGTGPAVHETYEDAVLIHVRLVAPSMIETGFCGLAGKP